MRVIRINKISAPSEYTDFPENIFSKPNNVFKHESDTVTINSIDYRISSAVLLSGRARAVDEIEKESYEISDIDDSEATKYYGYITKSGKWYILKEDTTTKKFRYTSGSDNYLTNWTKRDTLEYRLYSEVSL